MPKPSGSYKVIIKNKKFEVHALDPKEDRRDNIRLTLHSDEGTSVYHHFRGYEVMRLVRALEDALAHGPTIPGS